MIGLLEPHTKSSYTVDCKLPNHTRCFKCVECGYVFHLRLEEGT